MAVVTCGLQHLQLVALLLLWSTGYAHSELCGKAVLKGCLTPDRKAGQCVRIDFCESIRGMLDVRPLTEKERKYLQMSQCEELKEGQLPFVCCPLHEYAEGSPEKRMGSIPPTTEEEMDYDEKRTTEDSGDKLDVGTTPSTSTSERSMIVNPGVDDHSNWKYLSTDVCGASITDQIFGGEEARLKEYPWLALLQYKYPSRPFFECGGALISRRYVLTAAHCIQTYGYGQLWKVHLGEHDTANKTDCTTDSDGVYCADPVQVFKVETATIHPMYNRYQDKAGDHFHDIGLIRLDRDAIFSEFVMPICIPYGVNINQRHENTNMTVAGWGITEKGVKSNVKRTVTLPVITNAECEAVYPGKVINSQLCAGGEEGKDSCNGDSGGPLVTQGNVVPGRRGAQWVAAAIVSKGGPRCGVDGKPEIYTRIGPFVRWILDNIQP